MGVDRRAMMTMMIAATMLPGCADARPKAGPVDINRFRERFVDKDGRVVDSGNGGISHSEGQGYGMVLAEALGDRAGFELMWNWTRRTLQRPDGLFAWRYDPSAKVPVNDPNNATDGDILIAWALLRASRRWKDQNYAKASAAIRAVIAAKLVRDHGGRSVLLPGLNGFVVPEHITLNPSYYLWPALDAFRATEGGKWTALIRDGEALIQQARFGPTGLPTDWLDLGADGRIGPAYGRPPRFGFDAIRVPLYLAWSGRSAMLAPFTAYWRSLRQQNLPIPAWIDVVTAETAPYPVSIGGMAIVDLTLGTAPKTPLPTPPDADYFATVLASLAAIAGQAKPR